jgi:hypothetical protein
MSKRSGRAGAVPAFVDHERAVVPPSQSGTMGRVD